MASEIFAEGGKDVAVKITPGVGGILQVFVDGDKIYDKAEEGGQFPNLPRVKQMRAVIRERLAAAVTADD
jgi:predicted Rdx family selenoprotein